MRGSGSVALRWRARPFAACAAAGVMVLAGPAAGAKPLTTQAMQQAGQPANGLIVKFRDAPSHEVAQALRPGSARTPAQDESDRMRRVLGAAGLSPQRMRPVGRASQHLDFGQVLSGAEAQRMAGVLRQRPEVEWVVPNERERKLQVPNDEYFASTARYSGQWWLFPASGSNSNVLKDRRRGVPGLQTAWATSTGLGAPPVVVAVLDTGITTHPDLDAHVLPGYDFVSTVEYANDGNGRDADPSDPGDWVSQADKTNNPALFGSCEVENSSWHGTDIAGIVAAISNNNRLGVAGINWNARVLPVRVAGKCGADVLDIVEGMRWAAGLAACKVDDGRGTCLEFAPPNPYPARVVNISFGGSAACNPAYQTAIDELRQSKGAVVVAAAGNESGAVSRPASCSGVIGVAALNRDGFKAGYSNFGSAIVVSTVGGDPTDRGAWGNLLGDDGMVILDNLGTTVPCNLGTLPACLSGYSVVSGTSFSAPVVAGVVSLMLSVNPALTAAQIIDGVRLSARPHVTSNLIGACSAQNPGRCICNTASCGAGILDAAEALRYAAAPGSYSVPNWPNVNIDSTDVSAAVALGLDQPAGVPPVTPPAASGGGGGAWAWGWLLGLAVAVIGLATLRRRAQR